MIKRALCFAILLSWAAGPLAAAESSATNEPAKNNFLNNLFRRAVEASTNAPTATPTNTAPTLPATNSSATNSLSKPGALPSLTNLNNLSLNSLPAEQLTAGLKQALAKGLTNAVASLGRTNGFLTNAAVRIPLPANLAKIETYLRNVGQGDYVDEFVSAMNRAAEKAVPVASDVFVDALAQMTIADAQTLVTSTSKTAATDYFRRTTTNQLSAKFLPLVKDATAASGVTKAYKDLMGKSTFAMKLAAGANLDVDNYVTAKSLDGLFTMVAAEEARIRENPQARTTDLLQKVFGSLQLPK
jgi:hypothetical protein